MIMMIHTDDVVQQRGFESPQSAFAPSYYYYYYRQLAFSPVWDPGL